MKSNLFILLFILSLYSLTAHASVTVSFDNSSGIIEPCNTYTVTGRCTVSTISVINNFSLGIALHTNTSVSGATVVGHQSSNYTLIIDNQTVPANTDTIIDFSYDLIIGCELLNFQSTNINEDSMIVITGTDTSLLILNPQSQHQYTIDYPHLVLRKPSNLFGHVSDSLSLKRSITIKNNGSSNGIFNKAIQFISNNDDYSSFLNIGKVELQIGEDTVDITNILINLHNTGHLYSYYFKIDFSNNIFFSNKSICPSNSSCTLGPDSFNIIETIEFLNCPSALLAQSTFDLSYGCDTSQLYLCANSTAQTSTIKRGPELPNVVVSRILPAPNTNGIDVGSAFWNNLCPGKDTTYKVRIMNIGDDVAYNVVASLANGNIKSYSYILWNSLKIYHNGTQLNNYPSHTKIFLKDIISAPKPHCLLELESSGDSVLAELLLTIGNLKPDEYYDFEFKLLRCCSEKDDGTDSTDTFDITNDGSNKDTQGGLYYGDGDIIFAGHYQDECIDTCHCHPNDRDYYIFCGNYENTSNSPPLYTLYGGIGGNHLFPRSDGRQLFLDYEFEPSTPNLLGVSGGGCGDSSLFDIQIINFGALAGNVDIICKQPGDVPSGKFKVSWLLDPALQIIQTNQSLYIESHFKDTFIRWNYSSVSIQSGKIEAVFDICSLSSIIGSVKYDKYIDFRSFMSSARIHFEMKGCCNGQSTQKVPYQIIMYIAPCSNSCSNNTCDLCADTANCTWIPLASLRKEIMVICPGCHTPGIQVTNCSLLREDTSLGYSDTLDRGFADYPIQSISPISSYPKKSYLKLNHAMAGDYLVGKVTASFQDGASGNTNYQALDSFYVNHHSTLNVTSDKLDYLYLEQNIPYSNKKSFDINLESATLSIFRADSIPICSSDTATSVVLNLNINVDVVRRNNGVDSADNVYFYKLSLSNLINDGLCADYEFLPNDMFVVDSRFRICKNMETADWGVLSNKKECEFENKMYLSEYSRDTNISNMPFSTVPIADDIVIMNATSLDTLFDHQPNCATPYNCGNGYLFFCGAYSSLMYLYPIKVKNITSYGDEDHTKGSRKCHKSIICESTIAIGGENKNVFPYEYRMPPSFPDSISPITDSISPINRFLLNTSYLPGYTITYDSSLIYNPVHGLIDNNYGGRCKGTRMYYSSKNPEITHNVFLNNDSTKNYTVFNFNGATSEIPYSPLTENSFEANTFDCNGIKSDDTLWVGDEGFTHVLVLKATPVCNSIDTIFVDSSQYNGGGQGFMIEVPKYGCGDDTGTVRNSKDLLIYQKYTLPQPDISITLDSNQNVTKNIVKWTMTIQNSGDVAENAFLFFHNDTLNLTITKVTILQRNQCGSDADLISSSVFMPQIISTDSGYSIAQLGDILRYCSFSIEIEGTYSNCQGGGHLEEIPFDIGWNCFGKVTNSIDRVQACGIDSTTYSLSTIEESVNITFYEGSSYVENDTFSLCSDYNFYLGVISHDNGSAYLTDIKIELPDHLVLEEINNNHDLVNIKYSKSVSDTCSKTIAASSVIGQTYIFSKPFPLPCANDSGEINNGLKDNEIVEINFKIRPECGYNTQNPVMPKVTFDYTKFCDPTSTVSLDTLFNVWSYSGNNYCSNLNAVCNGTSSSCHEGSNGSASVSVTDSLSYSLLWNNGSTASSIANLIAGTYSVTVTDLKSCVVSCSYTVTQPLALISYCNGSSVSCNGGNDGSASISANGGTAPYSYLWSNGSSQSSISSLQSSAYYITVTDANGCSTSCSYYVTQPFALATSCNGTHVSCNGGNNGSISVTASGGTAPYSFLWSNGSSQSSISGLQSSAYYVTVTDANECSASCSYTITQPSTLSSSCSGTNASCNGGNNGSASVTAIGGTAPYSYLWNNSNSQASISNLSASSYSVTITDANGCSASCFYNVTEPSALSSSASIKNVSQSGVNDGYIILSITGGNSPFTFLWSTGATTKDITGLTQGVYNVIVTDSNECSVFFDYPVAGPANSCIGLRTQTQGAWGAMPHGGNSATYLYNNFASTFPNGLTVGCTNTLKLTTREAVTLFLPSGTTPFVLPSGLTVDPGSSLQNVFAGQVVTLALNIGFDNYDANFAPSAVNLDDMVITSGLFQGWTVGQLFDSSNRKLGSCLPDDTMSLSIYNQAVSAINENFDNGKVTGSFLKCPCETELSLSTISTDALCQYNCNGSVSVSVTSGTAPYIYNWLSNYTTASVSGLCSGNQHVDVTDQGGCSGHADISVSQTSSLSAIVSSTNVNCTNVNDGSASVTATTNSSPLIYNWSNGNTEQSITGLAAGSYYVTVSDASGCSPVFSVPITEPSTLSVLCIGSHVLCNGGSTGSIIASTGGGTLPYSYYWSNGLTSSSLNSLAAGNFSLTVTDAHNCSTSCSFTITEPEVLETNCSGSPVSCHNGSNGSVSVSATGGSFPYSYSWNTNAATSSISSLAAGTYTVTITDVPGCSAICSYIVTQPTALSASCSGTDIACHGGSNGSASVTTSGGTSSYSYSWSNSATASSISSLSASTYTVTITDVQGCSAICSYIVTQPYVLNVSIINNSPVCEGSDINLSANASGGTSSYAYSWAGATNFSSTSATPVITSATLAQGGIYSVSVSDANSCIAIASSTVAIDVCNHLTLSLENCSQVDATNIQFDLYAISDGSPSSDIRLNSVQFGVNFNSAVLQSGDAVYPSYSSGSDFIPPLGSFNFPSSTYPDHVRISQSVLICASDCGSTAPQMTVNTPYRIGTFLITSGIDYVANSSPDFSLQDVLVSGKTATSVLAYTESGLTRNFAEYDTTSNTWSTKSNFGGVARNYAVGFSIGTKGYIGTGYHSGIYLKDFWEYDPSNNTWTQKANFGGTSRAYAVGFSISSKGYIGTGKDSSGYTKDFWEYDPSNNTWTQKTDFGGVSRGNAVGFAIGSYGYIGTGYNGSDKNDFWQFNPSGNSWTQKTNFSGTSRRNAVGFNIDTVGYIGTGVSGSTHKVDFFMYNPATNSWTTKASLPGSPGYGTRQSAVGFSIGSNKGYIATGYQQGASAYGSDLWEYSKSANSWTQKTDFAGTARYAAAVFSIGGKGYLGTGQTVAQPVSITASGTGDLKRTLSVDCSINLNSCSTSLVTHSTSITCSNDSNGVVSVTTSGGTAPYSYLWSTDNTTQTVTGLPSGTYYVIVTDASPCSISAFVTVSEPTALSVSCSGINASCSNGVSSASVSATGGSPSYSYSWSNSATTSSITGLSNGTYSVTVTDQCGISASCSYIVTTPTDIVVSVGSNSPICTGGTIILSATTSGGTGTFSYIWAGPDSYNSTDTNPSISSSTSSQEGTYYLTITDANGCTTSESTNVEVDNCITTLSLTLIIEGYYLYDGQMQPTLFNESVSNATGAETDTIYVELHSPSGTYALVERDTALLMTDGAASAQFSPSVIGNSYYIVIEHRNAVQTWSASPITFSQNTSYDFTVDASQAYGLNMIQIDNNPYLWAIYNGDINKDENIDILDFPAFDYDCQNGLFGYYKTDLNGDGNVDLLDFPIMEYNIMLGVFSFHP